MKLNINDKIIEVDDTELSKALEEKKESIAIKSDLVFRTSEEDKSFAENLRKEGISTGAEIGRKEVIKGLGIEGEGIHKSDSSTIEAIAGLINTSTETALSEAKIEPDKKVLELQGDLKALKSSLLDKDNLIEKTNQEFKTFKETNIKISKLSGLIPDNIALPRDAVLTIMNSKIKTGVDENGVVFGLGQDGQPIKDDLRGVKPIDDVVGKFFNDNPYLLKSASGGAGGGDSGSGDAKQTLEEFIEEMKGKEVFPNSPEFVKIMGERQKALKLEV